MIRGMRQFLYFLFTMMAISMLSSCAYQVLKADKFLEKNEMAKAQKDVLIKPWKKEPENPAARGGGGGGGGGGGRIYAGEGNIIGHPVWSYDAVDSAHSLCSIGGGGEADTFPKREDKEPSID